MTTPTPPPNVTAQSDDNRIGFLLLVGIAIVYGVWTFFPGPFFGFSGLWTLLLTLPGIACTVVAVRRLLRPGCKMILRINHGGVTDFRLSEHAVPWQDIVGVEITRGWIGLLLPAVILVLSPGQTLPRSGTTWCRVLHVLLSFLYRERLLILCATIDIGRHEIHRAILHHHHHQHGK